MKKGPNLKKKKMHIFILGGCWKESLMPFFPFSSANNNKNPIGKWMVFNQKTNLITAPMVGKWWASLSTGMVFALFKLKFVNNFQGQGLNDNLALHNSRCAFSIARETLIAKYVNNSSADRFFPDRISCFELWHFAGQRKIHSFPSS